MWKRILMAALCAVGLVGCTTPVITNLTPTHQIRNPDNLYQIELAWHSRQRSIKPGSIKPYIVIGEDFFPMRPTPMVKDRWEAFVTVSPTNPIVNYIFKVDFDYFDVPIVRSDSKLSKPYQLRISDR